MERNIFDTLSEALEEIDGENYTGVDLVVNPPPNDHYLSDEEEGDGNTGIIQGANLPNDVTGTIEVFHETKDGDVEEDEGDSPATERRWKKGCRTFDPMPGFDEDLSLPHLYPELIDKSILEVYKLFFDEEVVDVFVTYTKLYAAQKNKASFEFGIADLLGLLYYFIYQLL